MSPNMQAHPSYQTSRPIDASADRRLALAPSRPSNGPDPVTFAPAWSWPAAGLVVGGSLFCLALIVFDAWLPALPGRGTSDRTLLVWHRSLNDPLRLVVAAVIGLLVTAVHRRPTNEPNGQAMHHAQMLLCVSGAMMMVIISDSLARAFGIAGAASIIRFRTPVEDPKDAAVLFLLMALGMASGLGAFALAGSGTAMLCVFLLLLDRFSRRKTRSLLVELVAVSGAFPADHVQRVFARHGVSVELREMSQGEAASAKYLATCAPDTSLEALNADLMAGEPDCLRAIAWEPAKKRQL
jgi:hypothetical protein